MYVEASHCKQGTGCDPLARVGRSVLFNYYNKQTALIWQVCLVVGDQRTLREASSEVTPHRQFTVRACVHRKATQTLSYPQSLLKLGYYDSEEL